MTRLLVYVSDFWIPVPREEQSHRTPAYAKMEKLLAVGSEQWRFSIPSNLSLRGAKRSERRSNPALFAFILWVEVKA